MSKKKDILTKSEVRKLIETHMTKQFILDARKVHGSKYDYSKTWITCSEEQIADFVKLNNITMVDDKIN